MCKKAVLSLFLSSLLLSGCTSNTPPSPKPSPEGEVMGYTLTDAQTAVLTADAVLTDCYSYTLKEGYGTPGADDSQFYQWFLLEVEHELSHGDIVAVLGEKNGISRVAIPYGDLPWLYGYVSRDLLSTDQADIEVGNQAIIEDCETYDSPNGTPLHSESARIKIIDRKEEWVQVQEYGTGAEPYWVRAANLSFDFDTPPPDRAQ